MSFLNKLFGASDTTPAKATPVARPPTAINAVEARARLNSATPPFLLDVREPYEYAAVSYTHLTLPTNREV